MAQTDSLDKIIGTYFAAVCREPFIYKGTEYKPKPLQVSPLIFRGFTCPEMCGGCCPRFSLDYLPYEDRPQRYDFSNPSSAGQLITREIGIGFSGRMRNAVLEVRQVVIYSDMQDDHRQHHCRNLNFDDGRCNVHGNQPFSCDFELIRFINYAAQDRSVLTQKLFGRGWAMLRVDGERGARCEMTKPDKHTVSEVIRKLRRLKQWIEYFGIEHCVDTILSWAESGPHIEPLIVPT